MFNTYFGNIEAPSSRHWGYPAALQCTWRWPLTGPLSMCYITCLLIPRAAGGHNVAPFTFCAIAPKPDKIWTCYLVKLQMNTKAIVEESLVVAALKMTSQWQKFCRFRYGAFLMPLSVRGNGKWTLRHLLPSSCTCFKHLTSLSKFRR